MLIVALSTRNPCYIYTRLASVWVHRILNPMQPSALLKRAQQSAQPEQPVQPHFFDQGFAWPGQNDLHEPAGDGGDDGDVAGGEAKLPTFT